MPRSSYLDDKQSVPQLNICLISLLALLLIAGCRREQWLQATLPTLAVLPSETPSITISPTLAINPNVTAPVIIDAPVPIGIVSLTPTPVGTYYTPTITPSPLPFWMRTNPPTETNTATFTRTPTLTPTDVPAARRTFAVDLSSPPTYLYYVDPSLPTYTPFPTPDVRGDIVDMPLPEFPDLNIDFSTVTPYPTNDGSYRATFDSINATAGAALETLDAIMRITLEPLRHTFPDGTSFP